MSADDPAATPDDISHHNAVPGAPDMPALAAAPDRSEGGTAGYQFPTASTLQGLRRARHGRMVGGVCAGVADALGVDVTVVRVAAVIFAIAGGLAIPIYLALWLLVPEEGTEHAIVSNFMRGPIGPRVVAAQAAAADAQGGAMSGCAPFSERSDEHDWSQAGPYRGWYTNRWRGGWSDPNQGMRIGDTERSAVSDVLSKHYAAGRLDDEEFNERMGQAMGAKTRGDLSGLLADLPPVEPAPGNVSRHRHGGRFGSFLMLCLTVLVVGSVASALWWTPRPHFGWVAIAVVAFFLLRWERHRHWHRAHEG